MKVFCYLASAALVVFGLLFAYNGLSLLAVQSLTLGALSGVATYLIMGRS